jgi:bacillithiol system protein YtxJ
MRLTSALPLVALLRGLAARVVPGPIEVESRRRARLIPLADADDLNEVFARSAERPVILFLHDPGCPTSGAAYREMVMVDYEIALVDVQTGTRLTQSVQERTGVRHESPQVIVLRCGQAAWSASHFAIRTGAVEAALHRSQGS